MAEMKAAKGSPLERLRAEREAMQQRLHIDLRVPRYELPIFVRYGPLSQARTEAIDKRFRNKKGEDRSVLLNAAILVEACQGVFVHDEDGEPVGIDPEQPHVWPKFDAHLAEMLGIETASAADVARWLYGTDGDLISTAQKVVEWSGYGDTEDDSGN